MLSDEPKQNEACNILLNVFSDQGVREYVEAQINLVWDKLESDIGKFLPFFKAFHMVRPTQTLLLLQEYIEQESYHPFDARTLPFKDDQQGKSVSDDILQILGNFGDHPELPSALDLLLLYYKKRPDLFEQFYSIYAFYAERGSQKPLRSGQYDPGRCKPINFIRLGCEPFFKARCFEGGGWPAQYRVDLHADTFSKSACFGIPKDALVTTLSDLSARKWAG